MLNKLLSDSQITNDVVHALLWNAKMSPASIDVTTKDNVVVLSGKVDSHIKKWSAREVAHNVSGVEDVIDEIKVNINSKRPDENILQDVQMALQSDNRIDATWLKVDTEKSTIILTGRVSSLFQKIAAEETARWVKGVMEVDNRIEVELSNRNIDVGIKDKAVCMLSKSTLFEDTAIAIGVQNQTVHLFGKVSNREQKMLAEAIVSIIDGVVQVKNDIDCQNKREISLN